MLKRQRPASPAPTFSPILANPPIDIPFRDTKRRRVLPPALDGQLRGWDRDYDNDDAEEDVDNDSTDIQSHVMQHATTEYKSANSVLHELHALNQHRLIFSSAPHTALIGQQSHALEQVFNRTGKHAPLLSSGRMPASPYHDDQSAAMKHNALGSTMNTNDDAMSAEEVQRVMERYEDTNKLLGSLVLSRRRELRSFDHAGT